jgi:hypothetical protein
VKGEWAQIQTQKAVIFHLLDMGQPMLDYKGIKPLLQFLGVPKMPQRHWSDNFGWDMAMHMNKHVFTNLLHAYLISCMMI